MTPEEFKKATFSELARKTHIDRFQWCRYLNGKVSPNYSTLISAAIELNMTVSTLVECIEKRIHDKAQKTSCA